MSTEVELFEPRRLAPVPALTAVPDRADIDSWIYVASDVIKLAGYICETDFVPKAYRGNPHATAAAILAGRELDLPPMTALRHVHIVEGAASLSAEYKRARVLAAGHDLDIIELTTTRCRVSGRRKGSGKPPLEITFTIEDARRARLVKDKGAWETRPRRMLFARAATEVCDFLFADVTNGLPTAELLEEGGAGDGEFAGYAESPGQAPPAPAAGPPAPKTAQRRSRRVAAGATSGPGPAPDSQPAAATSPPAADNGQPPLPGEDDPPGPEPMSDEERHGKLVGIVQAHFKRLGYADRDKTARLLACEKLAQTGPLDSSKDLTVEQLSVVADTLARCRTRENLDVLLVAGDKPDESQSPGEDGGADG